MKPNAMKKMLDAAKYANDLTRKIELIIKDTIKGKITEKDALKRINYVMQECGTVSDKLREASNLITGGEDGNYCVRGETRGG